MPNGAADVWLWVGARCVCGGGGERTDAEAQAARRGERRGSSGQQRARALAQHCAAQSQLSDSTAKPAATKLS